MEDGKTIIVVDDNNANLIACKSILKSHYAVYPALSSAKLFELLEHIKPDLILLDVEMPDVDGYGIIKKLKENDAYKEIPVIFLSARRDATSEKEGLDLGAIDYFHKPFYSTMLLRRIEIHLSVIEYRKALLKREQFIEDFTSRIKNELLAPANSIFDVLSNALGTENENEKNAWINQAKKTSEGILDCIKDIFGSINSEDN